MARLIFDSATIGSDTLNGITVDGLEISKEATTVEIEDGRVLNESFTGSITIRSVNTTFADGGDILSTGALSSDGTIPAKTTITLNGAGSSPSITLTNVYVMGHRDFSNGRVETVLTATKANVSQAVIDTV